MIRIMILDDDPTKIEHIQAVITSVPEIRDEHVCVVADLISARDVCRQQCFDLLILDLRLPNRRGDDPEELAGCEFIKELTLSTTLRRPYHILGVTAYEDLLCKADTFFQEEVWRVIRYDPALDDWRRQLRAKLDYLVNSKKELSGQFPGGYWYDLAIVTALREPELQAILDVDGGWSESAGLGDPTIYHVGTWKTQNHGISVVAACAHQMGMAAAGVLSAKICSRFRPRYLAMAGIAAGTNGKDQSYGDILLADQSWDYGSGKRKRRKGVDVFDPDPRAIPLNVGMKERFLAIKGREAFLRDIESSWRGKRPPSRLNLFMGPVASGAAVIQDDCVIKQIRAQNRKLIGLDMETYGVFFAGENCPQPKPTTFSVKSISDFADDDKDDEYRLYAAYTSARYIHRFACECLAQTAVNGGRSTLCH